MLIRCEIVLAYKIKEKICKTYIFKSVAYISIDKLNISKGSSKRESLRNMPRHVLKALIFIRLMSRNTACGCAQLAMRTWQQLR
jgi:hypothetical protein